METLEGQLLVRVEADSAQVSIRSTRSLHAVKVFSGRAPADVVRLLPSLFSVCGSAQAAAAHGACEAALGLGAPAEVRRHRRLLLFAETVKEHLWRLLLDWPKTLAPMLHSPSNGDAGAQSLAGVMQAFRRLRASMPMRSGPWVPNESQQVDRASLWCDSVEAPLDQLAASAVASAFQVEPEIWLGEIDSPAALFDWAQKMDTIPAELVRTIGSHGLADAGAASSVFLPPLPINELERRLRSADAAAFIARPQWQGRCCETGPLSRALPHPLISALIMHHGRGLLARLAALLVELARAALQIQKETDALRQGADRDGESPRAPEMISAGVIPSCSTSYGNWQHAMNEDQAGVIGRDAGVALRSLSAMHERSSAIGIAQVEAARGRLVHRVVIEDGLIKDYQILAPTEWNFHPEGVVAEGLAGIARSGARGAELEALCRLYITAVDPCVGYRLSVS